MTKEPLSFDDNDTPWKEGLDRFLPYFLEICFPRIFADVDWNRGYDALDKEFHQLVPKGELGKRLADKLFRVWLKDGTECWLLIHIEVQGQPEKLFPKRMFVYNYRALDVYNRPVVSLAVLCDQRANWRPKSFEYGRWGSRMGLDFLTVKLLDFAKDQATLETSPNPFAAVVLGHLKAQETRNDPIRRSECKIRLIKGLYERGLQAEDVRQLFRIIDWQMQLPDELQHQFREEIHRTEEEKRMPYVTSIEKMARKEGRAEGHQEGLQKGIWSMLKVRFGPECSRLRPLLDSIRDVDRLDALLDELENIQTLDEVENRLQ